MGADGLPAFAGSYGQLSVPLAWRRLCRASRPHGLVFAMELNVLLSSENGHSQPAPQLQG